MRDLAFIVSGGRTGTNLLGETLQTCIDDCRSEHEPDILVLKDYAKVVRNLARFGLWHMLVGRLMGQTGARAHGYRLLSGSASPEDCFSRMRKERASWHATVCESLLIESNYQLWPFAGRLHEIWPGARTVVIVRDPRDWVRSWMNRRGRFDRHDWVGVFPPGRLTPAVFGDSEHTSRWNSMGTFERLAWEWTAINGHLARAAESPHVRLFRFEDLFGERARSGSLVELANFVADHGVRRYRVGDVDQLRRTVRNASAGKALHWRNWDAKQARTLDRHCGELMLRFGYGEEPDWRHKLGK